MANSFDGYGWIKVRKYEMDKSLPWDERYCQLERHHLEETTFLIEKVRELAAELERLNVKSEKSSHTDAIRYSAKLLFQFRVDLGSETGKRRLCEERIVTFRAASAQLALAIAKRTGKKGEFDYDNSDGHRVYFEFVGVMELIDLRNECDTGEVWYEIKERVSPMERRAALIPHQSQLSAVRNKS